MVVEPSLYYNIFGFSYIDTRNQQNRFVYFEGTEKMIALLGVIIIKILWSYGFIVMQRFSGKISPIILTFY